MIGNGCQTGNCTEKHGVVQFDATFLTTPCKPDATERERGEGGGEEENKRNNSVMTKEQAGAENITYKVQIMFNWPYVRESCLHCG